MKSQLASKRDRRKALIAVMMGYQSARLENNEVFDELVTKGVLKMLFNLDPMERTLLFVTCSPLRQRYLLSIAPNVFQPVLN